MGKIIERVRHQQLKRAMNEIDERRRIDYFERSEIQRLRLERMHRDFQEESRRIDERLEAEKTESAKKSIGKNLWGYVTSGKL